MINNVVLTGRLTADPLLNKTTTGVSVVSFTLAVNRRFKKENQPTTDFISCIAWNKTAEILSDYTSKGSQIAISGRLNTRNYEDKTGRRVYVTEVIAEQIVFLDSKKDGKNTVKNDDYYFEDTNEDFDFSDFNNESEIDISGDDLPF